MVKSSATAIGDGNIILDFNNGEEVAFSEIFKTYYSELYIYSTKLIKDENIAKDIISDTFIALFYKKNKDFQSVVNIKAFLYASVRNNCLYFLRNKKAKDRKQQEYVRTVESYSSNEVEQGIELAQREYLLLIDLKEPLGQLSANRLRIIELLFFRELSYKEAAEVLRVSVETIKSQRKDIAIIPSKHVVFKLFYL